MLEINARIALNEGYYVIMEGIMSMESYGGMIKKVVEVYGVSRCKFVYLNISLEESKKRHEGRLKSKDFGVEMLDKWYSYACPSGLEGEIVIDALKPVEEIDYCVLNYGKFSRRCKKYYFNHSS